MINSFKSFTDTFYKDIVLNPKYQQVAVISAILLLSAFFAYRGFDRIAMLVVLGIVGMGAAAILLRLPALGMVALTFVGFAVRFELGTGSASAINPSIMIVVGLLGLWVASMFIRYKQIRLVRSGTNAPLLAFAMASLLAFLSGQMPWFILAQPAPIRAQIGGLAIFILSLAIFLTVVNQLDDIVWLKRITWALIISGSAYIFIRVIATNLHLFNIARYIHPHGIGSLFWVWLVSLSFSQLLVNKELGLAQRIFLLASVVATIYVGFVQSYDWKSGWLPPLICMAVIFWLALPQLRIPAIFAGVIGGLVYLGSLNTLVTGAEDYSILTRFEAWKILGEIIKANPVLGLGPANYYFYTPLFSILGYYVQFNSHNNYIDIVAQTGIIGLVCFLWLAWEIGKTGWRLNSHPHLDGFSKAYVIGALGGLVGTLAAGMLGDWVIPFVYNIGFNGFRASVLGWLFLGGLVALDKIYQRQPVDGQTV